MASLTKRPEGTWQLQYVDAEGNRRTITLGKQRDGEPVNRRELRAVQSRIERLIAASISGE